MKNNKKTVEGIRTCKVIYEDLMENYYPSIEMPIVDALYSVLYCGVKPSEAIQTLMLRELKQEH